MRFTLLYIRSKQLQREINSLGLYVILLTGVLFLAIFICFRQFEKGQNIYYVPGFLAFICVYLQSSRKDKLFVYSHIDHPHLQIFSEYIALTLPFSLPALATKSWPCYPLLVSVLLCLPFFNFTYREITIFKNISKVIPATNFEWLSGFRKSYLFFCSLYLGALAFCWLRILPLFFLWFLTTLIATFHQECEPVTILRAGGKIPREFLLAKLAGNCKYLLILYTPVLLINIIVNSGFLVISLLFLSVQLATLCFAICLKYAGYTPNKSQAGNNLPLTVVSMGAAIPYALPVPALLALIYFYRAEKKLNQYLSDQL